MFRLRAGPFLASLAAATVFVVLRVAYRVLFGGADGGGATLVDLPAVRLAGPFAHVHLFGPVTTGGLLAAAASALPFALTIIAFGLLGSLVDVSRVAASWAGRGPLQGLARAAVIAWATLPGLVAAVRAVRTARRLRAARGVRSFVVPVLEHALERAMALAGSLESRGFASLAPAHPVPGAAALEARRLRLWHRERQEAPALAIDDISAVPGDIVLVTGATGSGKSTLLRAITGLHEHGDGGARAGVLRVFGHERASALPRDTAALLAYVPQRPRTGFVAERVRDELDVTAAMRRARLPRGERRLTERADAAGQLLVARRLGLEPLLDRELSSLSAGEAMRVAIAAAIAGTDAGAGAASVHGAIGDPAARLLVLDEPLADLDTAAREVLLLELARIARDARCAIIVAEHRADAFAELATTHIRLGLDGDASAEHRGPLPEASERRATVPGPISAAALACELRNVPIGRGRDEVNGPTVDLELRSGEIVTLYGPNGAGKSTLLERIALPARRGRAELPVVRLGNGVDVSRCSPRERRAAVALVPERVDDLFSAERLGDEFGDAARERFVHLAGLSPQAAQRALERHPRDLSAGQRLLAGIAIQLEAEPRVLLVDEPTRGLDARATRALTEVLRDIASEGTAVLIATHDVAFAAEVADRQLALERGVLSVREAPRAVAMSNGLAPRQRSLAPSPGPSPAPAPAQDPDPDPRSPSAVASAAAPPPSVRRRWPLADAALWGGSLVAATGFAWPLVIAALPAQAREAATPVALALVPIAVLVCALTLDRGVRTARAVAMLGVLAALGTAARIAGAGVGGVELVFIVLILAGRAYGARFGMLLGLVTIAVSSLVWGGFGPWTPFQMFACGWVGAGAGLLPRTRRGSRRETAIVTAYGVVAAYAFGLVMNLWFWPFAVGSGTGASYDPGAPLGQNLASFLAYSLVTSTLTWDTVRAITTGIGLAVLARPALAALRRAGVHSD